MASKVKHIWKNLDNMGFDDNKWHSVNSPTLNQAVNKSKYLSNNGTKAQRAFYSFETLARELWALRANFISATKMIFENLF